MSAYEKLVSALPDFLREPFVSRAGDLEDLRLRAGRPACFDRGGRSERVGRTVTPEALRKTAAALMEYSLYRWEDELGQGFFTLEGGCRVGVAGRFSGEKRGLKALSDLQALCIRIARAVPGCADALLPLILAAESPKSLLLISPPGMGKTTCLRDLVRQLSGRGLNVAVADERGELAALRAGMPALDVGPQTDVIDLMPKWAAIPCLLRSMAPDVIATDELGDARDAAAVREAKRCGVAVLATAHGGDIGEALARAGLSDMRGCFDLAVRLGGAPGRIAEVRFLGAEPC